MKEFVHGLLKECQIPCLYFPYFTHQHRERETYSEKLMIQLSVLLIPAAAILSYPLKCLWISRERCYIKARIPRQPAMIEVLVKMEGLNLFVLHQNNRADCPSLIEVSKVVAWYCFAAPRWWSPPCVWAEVTCNLSH